MNRTDFKVCIPMKDKPMGGMYSFVRIFRKYLAERGNPVTCDITDDYHILFVNSFMVDYDAILLAKRRLPDVVVVQRVDGSARDYGRQDDADERQARVNLLADLTIFQSRYSKYSAREKFKVIARDGPIIYNPVDIHIFRPEGRRVRLEGDIRVCNASFSTNVKKGTWRIGNLAQVNPDVDFILCGRYPELPDLRNIHLLGHLSHEDLSAVMRSSHVFLHLAENDPCPNVVLEGLASGLPVLYKDSGGTRELVGDCGVPLEVDNFPQKLEHVLARRDELSQAARYRAVTGFAPHVIFPEYLEAITSSSRRPLPGWREKLGLYGRIFPLSIGRQKLALKDRVGQAAHRLVAKARRLLQVPHQ